MATTRYTLIDGRSSSKFLSTLTIVGIVCVCLIGGWMIMSSSIGPLQNVKISFQEIMGGAVRTVNGSYVRNSDDDSRAKVKDDSSSDVQENGNVPLKSSSDNEMKKEEKRVEDERDENGKTNEVAKSRDKELKWDGGEKKDGEEEKYRSDDKTADGGLGTGEWKTDNDQKKAVAEGSPVGIKQGEQTKTKAEKEPEPNHEGPNTAKKNPEEKESQAFLVSEKQSGYRWKLCNTTAGPDYIPCLDNIQAIRNLQNTKHYEHRERHCPDEALTCLVPLPERYTTPVKWPKSREKIWFSNVPHTQLAEYKGGQNWVKVSGQYIIFPGGGTQFPHGAPHYIDLIQQTVPDIAWGKRVRVILDVGCGVASFGGYLFDKEVLTMSLAPKDEHEAQVQFALERGIPAISAVMGTKRLPFPSMVFDIVHCSRCRVPWHIEGGKLLLELNRVLRPGGHFVWSATPVYRKNQVDVGIWRAMSNLTKSMCWELVDIARDKLNIKNTAVYRKPTSNDCYETRTRKDPPLCEKSDDPNAAWNITLNACMHKLPLDPSRRGSHWPAIWPSRLEKGPYWMMDSNGQDFTDDSEHWRNDVSNLYMNGMGIDWSSVRNVMDMRAVYGGFAAALKDLKVWVMNVVPVSSNSSEDTLAIIYERGLFGMYHDWCESFSTYPRSYDLLHAHHLFSRLRMRCNIVAVMAEVDRILRPDGKLIVVDNIDTISEVEAMAKSLRWVVRFANAQANDRLICLQKTKWRPSDSELILSAIV